MENPRLVVCGSIAIDRIMNFSGRYRDLIKPEKIHVLSLSPLLDKLENTPGGVGANIAYNLALLGERLVLLGSVGLDAKDYITSLSKAGIDTSHIHFSKLPTASFNVITDSEGNQVGGFYPGAMSESDSLVFEPWHQKNALLMVSSHNPKIMNRQVNECQQYGLRLVYDPGQQVSVLTRDDLAAGLSAAELVFVNDYEQSSLADKMGITPAQLKKQVPILVTTLGREGSVIEGANVPSPVHISIARPKQVMDPTGAGDAYRAGFLYGYLRQWDLTTCGRLGAVVASFIVEHHGTQIKFSRQAIIERYKSTFNEEIQL